MNISFLESDRYGTKLLIEKDIDFVPRIDETFIVDIPFSYKIFKVVSVQYDVLENKVSVIGVQK
ncbi:MAG: hypothetical protein RBT49_08445 [Bacteroidales bacterium]|jgi:hypothetical protein|nr:hypothetical protein [Bacteroidales bacterium]